MLRSLEWGGAADECSRTADSERQSHHQLFYRGLVRESFLAFWQAVFA